jgi:hypothetical protein
MGIKYFNDHTWAELTREERFYCFRLYEVARHAPAAFAHWIINQTGLNTPDSEEWDIGVEVCLYRDLLWHQGKSVRPSKYSPKRTFDLCLFSPEAVIIIEAKAEQGFGSEQIGTFKSDLRKLGPLLGLPKESVKLIGLASSRLRDKCKAPFHGRLTWKDLYDEYKDPLFEQADKLYKSKERKLKKSTRNPEQ